MDLSAWQLLLLAGLGLIAGALNVMAGGGSLLTLPAMVLMGIPAPTANGTNRIAILAQNVTAIQGFRSQGFSDFRLSLTLALAALPGAVLGAFAGTMVRGETFNRILAVIMIAVMLEMIWKEQRKRRQTKSGNAPREAQGLPISKARLMAGHVCMIGVGFYGGFIQAGVGFLLMAVLHNVLRIDLVRVNMHKVFIVASYTLVAVIIFVSRGHVLWLPGLVLAVGNSLGGWLGSQLSVKGGEVLIRRILFIALTAMALKLLFG